MSPPIRLRENAVSGRTLMASDVAFGEALPHVDALDHQVAETIVSMIETADRDLASTRDQQILALAGALGVLGVAAVLLTPAPKRRDDAIETPATGDGAPDVPAAPTMAVPPAAAPWAAEPVAAAPPLPVAAPPTHGQYCIGSPPSRVYVMHSVTASYLICTLSLQRAVTSAV